MINTAFKIISDAMGEILLKQNFKKISVKDKKNQILFIKDFEGYAVCFNEDKKCFELFECSMEDDEVKLSKSISVWLFDPDEDTEKQAKDIAQDFKNTVENRYEKKTNKAVKKKKKSDEDNNVTPMFLMNRIVNIFPELKDAIQEEKENYENFRGVTFAREKALPCIKQTLTTSQPQDKFKKLCTVFSNLYSSGDLDTKSIITIVFLNAIEEESARENIKTAVSDELKDAMNEAFKIRNKKIKPEKIKKRSTFISDTLQSARAQSKN